MWETLQNAWKIPELRKKILYTLMMLVIYRLLCFVIVPGVDHASVTAAMGGASAVGGLVDFVSMMTGSRMESFTIMAMGITPYINASIIMQLLTVAIPKLEALRKEGEEGRKKIAQITRYVTIGLGFAQAVALSLGLNASHSWHGYITIGICLAAGTALAMWIGERINEHGLGNGISLLIFAGIVSRLANSIITTGKGALFVGNVSFVQIAIVVVMTVVMIAGVVLVDLGERRIPVQYAKRVVGRRQFGGQSTHIPLKVNSSGVLPLIFASSIMQFPSTIMSFFPSSAINIWWQSNFHPASGWYISIFALLIVAFTFFYSSISFNPIEISKNIQQNGGMIPGVRQGKPTSDFIGRVSRRITLFGSLFLAALVTIQNVSYILLGVQLPLAASSLMIAVSVAIETTRQLESQMVMRHYKGFLK